MQEPGQKLKDFYKSKDKPCKLQIVRFALSPNQAQNNELEFISRIDMEEVKAVI